MARYPTARVHHDESSIAYYPDSPDGFTVRLRVLQEQRVFSVFYSGSHEEFTTETDAILAFGYGLSTGCRLREYSRRGEAYRWIVEIWDPLGWRPDWEIIRFSGVSAKLWSRPKVRLLQNRLIDVDGGTAARAA